MEFPQAARKSHGGGMSKKVASLEAEYLAQNRFALSSILDVPVEEKLILILCGIPGSGKSTLANRITNEIIKFKAVCQDVLGRREIVFSSAQSILDDGDSVIIDRCNFNTIQRSHWLKLSKLNNNVRVICLVMPDYLNVDVCSARAFNRKDEFHGENEDWEKICKMMKSDFQFPTFDEGISLIFECKNNSDVDEFVSALAARGNLGDEDSKAAYRERWARIYMDRDTKKATSKKIVSANPFAAAFGEDSDEDSDGDTDASK